MYSRNLEFWRNISISTEFYFQDRISNDFHATTVTLQFTQLISYHLLSLLRHNSFQHESFSINEIRLNYKSIHRKTNTVLQTYQTSLMEKSMFRVIDAWRDDFSKKYRFSVKRTK